MKADLFLFAGEKSGDLLGADLLSSLYKQNPHLSISGVGGPHMRAEGMDLFLSMEKFEVMGFSDLFTSLPRIIQLFRRTKKHLLDFPPKGIVFIDYPGFNLRLAKALYRKNCQTKKIQYVCPSVWAWGKKRIPLMEKTLDSLLTLLPFESELFHPSSLDTHYVGHPAVHKIASHRYDTNWRASYQIPPKNPILSIFPGSREQEVRRNFPFQIREAVELAREFPRFTICVSRASPKLDHLLLPHLPKRAILIDSRHLYELMRDTQLAIATSGTVTLQLALHEVPTVITYAISPLDTVIAYYLLRIRLPYYALPNLLLQKMVFPELFGPMLTKENLQKTLRQYLSSEYHRQSCIASCRHLKSLLGNQDTSKEAAQIILQTIAKESEAPL